MYEMKVRQIYYAKLKSGEKTIELRLFDEKRQKIRIGEIIEFSCFENAQDKIQVEVLALHKGNDFEDLFNRIDIKKAGFTTTAKEILKIMEEFYPISEQRKYGVLGIEIRRI